MTGLPATFTPRNIYTKWLLAWTVVQALVTGMVLGNLYPSESVWGNPSFNWGAFWGGVVGSIIATIPFWAVLGLGNHLASGIAAVHWDLADLRERLAQQQTAAGPAPDFVQAIPATAEAWSAEGGVAAQATPIVPEIAGVTVEEVLARVLRDSATQTKAKTTRRVYGDNATAAFLTRKAVELGYSDIRITKEHLPPVL